LSRRGQRANGPHGILYVDKPAGPTSAEVVDWVRWTLGGQPAGHFGTLDPAATGLLVIGVGFGTRLNPYVASQTKVYRARIILGRSTTTADAQGETLSEQEISESEWLAAIEQLPGMVGLHALPPPVYSAAKIAGERAHTIARRGESLELAPRPMTVVSISEIASDRTTWAVEATLRVSTGTYIRSLATELGRRIGCPAHLGELRRLACGPASVGSPVVVSGFHVESRPPSRDGKPRHRLRWTVADSTPEGQRSALLHVLQSPASVLEVPVHAVTPNEPGADLLRRLCEGQTVNRSDPGWETSPGGECVGVVPSVGEGLIMVRTRAPDLDRLRPDRVVVPPRQVRGLSETDSSTHQPSDALALDPTA